MNLTQFNIPLGKNLVISGEYEGNIESKKAIIFAHGFGVKRDSWGMFDQLGDYLKSDYLVIRFDFVQILEKENTTKVFSLNTQAEMLNLVIKYATEKLLSTEINIIAHSQGCLVTSLLAPNNIYKIILVASPIENSYARMKSYFSNREGTIINEKGTSHIKRSDGSWTIVESDFWQDIKSINPIILFKALTKKTNLFFIRALNDQVIPDKNYKPLKELKDISYIELPGNHNFENKARENWLKTIAKIFNN